jgi:PAS domain S-box-containing protein
LNGQRVEVLLPESKRAMHVIHREIYAERSETRPMGHGLDLEGQRKDRSTFPVEISLSPINTANGWLAAAVVRDVSRQRRSEEALRRSEERHRLLAEQAHDVIFRYRLLPTPGFEYVSTAIARLLKYEPEEFYVDDQLIFRIVHPDDRSLLEQALSAQGPRSFALRLIRRDGEVRWFEQSMSPVLDHQGVVTSLEGIARDVTDRRAADEERQQLLTQVQTQLERERIAGDLHDDTIQSIYAVGLGLHAALVDAAVSKEDALQRAVNALNAVIGELRTYMQGLSGEGSGGPDPETLEARLRALLGPDSGTEWSVSVDSGLRLDSVLDRHVYLLAKELISNVHRHARASKATLSIQRDPTDEECLLLQVTDNGAGFNRRSVPAGSYGLRSMEQRVTGLEGSLDIDSAPGRGAMITVRLRLRSLLAASPSAGALETESRSD